MQEIIKNITTPPKSLQPADSEKINKLLDEINSIKGLFNNALNLTEGVLSETINVEEYNRINNKLIELENAVMNLTMLTGK